jgi:hypothetical protein
MDTKEKIAVMQQQLAVMQAFVDGKTIEFRSKKHQNSWGNMIQESLWSWSDTDYRVKPEPEVLYVNGYNHSDFCAYTTRERARVAASPTALYVAKKFVAVEE